MIFRRIRQAGKDILHPEQAYKETHTRTLESMVNNYLKFVLTIGILAAILAALFSLGRSVYYDLFLSVDVQYLRLLNYLVGKLFSVAFGYLMAGTFGLFFLSLLLRMILRIKYVQVLKILFIATIPLLLFGWIPGAIVGAAIWSLFLIIIGYRLAGTQKKMKKTSLQQRD